MELAITRSRLDDRRLSISPGLKCGVGRVWDGELWGIVEREGVSGQIGLTEAVEASGNEVAE